MTQILESKAWHISDYSRFLESSECSPKTMARVVREVLAKFQCQIFTHGNVREEMAKMTKDILLEKVAPTEVLLPQESDRFTVELDRKEEVTLLLPTPSSEDTNSAVEVHFQLGPSRDDPKLEMTLEILNQIAYNSAFQELRTNQQLGYLVTTYKRATSTSGARIIGFSVLLQSNVLSAYDCEDRIDTWIEQFRKELVDMDEKEFANTVAGLIDNKTEKNNKLTEAASEHWQEIESQQYRFFRRFKDAEVMKTLEKADVMDLLDKYIIKGGPERRKLSVMINSQTKPLTPEHLTALESRGPFLQDLEGIRSFKETKNVYKN